VGNASRVFKPALYDGLAGVVEGALSLTMCDKAAIGQKADEKIGGSGSWARHLLSS